MAKHFFRYGRQTTALEETAALLETALKIKFELRESSYWGGDYFMARSAVPYAVRIKLHLNQDLIDKKPIFRDHAAHGLILHADEVQKSELLTQILDTLGFILLEQETV